MPATFTVDGQAGAGVDLEGAVFNGVTSFTINVDTGVLELVQGDVSKTTFISIPVLSAVTVGLNSNKIVTVTIAD